MLLPPHPGNEIKQNLTVLKSKGYIQKIAGLTNMGDFVSALPSVTGCLDW